MHFLTEIPDSQLLTKTREGATNHENQAMCNTLHRAVFYSSSNSFPSALQPSRLSTESGTPDAVTEMLSPGFGRIRNWLGWESLQFAISLPMAAPRDEPRIFSELSNHFASDGTATPGSESAL